MWESLLSFRLILIRIVRRQSKAIASGIATAAGAYFAAKFGGDTYGGIASEVAFLVASYIVGHIVTYLAPKNAD